MKFSIREVGFPETAGYRLVEMASVKDPRVKQVLYAFLFFTILVTSVVSLLVGWRKLPGLLGEWVGIMVGAMSTPFLLEGTFVFIGIVTIISLNYWRLKKEGDEFVFLDQVSGPEVPENLPDSARWALYAKEPLPGETPSLLAQAEGAFSIGDFNQATQILAAMTTEELSEPETLRFRLDLARSTGHKALASRLEEELGLAANSGNNV